MPAQLRAASGLLGVFTPFNPNTPINSAATSAEPHTTRSRGRGASDRSWPVTAGGWLKPDRRKHLLVAVGAGSETRQASPQHDQPTRVLGFTSRCDLRPTLKVPLMQTAAERLSCTQLEFRLCIIAREARQLSNQEWPHDRYGRPL